MRECLQTAIPAVWRDPCAHLSSSPRSPDPFGRHWRANRRGASTRRRGRARSTDVPLAEAWPLARTGAVPAAGERGE